MRKRLIFVGLFLLFLLEGVIVQAFTKENYSSSFSIFPRLVLIVIIYLSIYQRKNYALFFAVIFGLLYDLVFGRVFGIYTVSMIGVVYLSIWFVQFFHPTFLIYMIIQTLVITGYEIFIYGLLRIYQLVQVSFVDMFVHVLMPTLIFNLLFATLFYPLLNKLIGKENM